MTNNNAENAWKEWCNRNWQKGPLDVKTAFLAGYNAGAMKTHASTKAAINALVYDYGKEFFFRVNKLGEIKEKTKEQENDYIFCQAKSHAAMEIQEELEKVEMLKEVLP